MRRSRLAFAAPILLALCACAPRLADVVPLQLVHQSWTSGDSSEELHHLLLTDGRGDTLTAILRQPALRLRQAESLPGILLLAGRETGRAAAAVIPGPLEAVVLAVEYPDILPEEVRVSRMLSRLPEIRRAAYRVPGVLRGAARFLADQPAVDRERIALVGVSFGVPFAAAAARDSIFCCVALHHGGADLGLLFRTILPVENGFLRGVAATFASHYFRRLEPARHVELVSPRPLLLINGLHDELVPRRSALLLASHARSPVRQIWLPHDHLMPGDLAVMRELADSTLRHFPQLRR